MGDLIFLVLTLAAAVMAFAMTLSLPRSDNGDLAVLVVVYVLIFGELN